jgi:hypothetical protein
LKSGKSALTIESIDPALDLADVLASPSSLPRQV